jgi:uncharacterized phiE125 gp8 family phage protein
MSKVTGTSVLVDRFPFGDSDKAIPVGSAVLKNHIQVTHSEDDDIILGSGGYVHAATDQVEKQGSISLITQTRTLTIGSELLSALSGEEVHLPFGPIQAVTEIGYLDTDGTQQVLPPENYRVSLGNRSVYFQGDTPTLAEGPGTVWVNYTSGFGDSSDDVPAAWQNCVMVLAMRMYDFRGADSGQTNDTWARMFKHMILAAGGEYRA